MNNKFIYLGLRKQLINFVVLNLSLGFLIYLFLLHDVFKEVKIEQQIHRELSEPRPISRVSDSYTDYKDLQGELFLIAKKNNLKLKVLQLGEDSLQIDLLGQYKNITNFLVDLTKLQQLIAIDSLKIEKNNKLKGMIIIKWLENKND